MEPHHNRSYTAQSEVQEVINDCDNVYRTLKNRQNSDPKFRENNVLLVGGSGTGKDSLLYYFKKTPLKITEAGELEASAPLEGVCIGHSCSETIVPASVVVDGITYWSCPGFSDTRGSKQDLVNMLAINNILHGNIKIVIVIDEAGIQNDRHKEIFECVRKIKNNMLPNIANDLSQHLGLIVTRGEYQSSQNTIQDLLEDINDDSFNRDYNDVVQTVKYLIENRTAYFPETSSGEEVYPSNFRDDILKMIQQIPDYLKLENDTVRMQFDDKVKSFLGDMHVALLAQTNDIIENHLFKSIKILLDNSRSNIDRLANNSFRVSYADKIKEIRRNMHMIEILIMGLVELVSINGMDPFTHDITSFIDKIKEIRTKMNAVDKNSKGHVLLDSIHNVFMDILPYNNHAVEHLQQIKRISTCIEFVCKYYDAPFFIDKWITGLQGLNQELSDCENYTFDKRKEATIANGANIVPAMLPVVWSGAVTVVLGLTGGCIMGFGCALLLPEEEFQDAISGITDESYIEAAITTGATIARVILPGTVRVVCATCVMAAAMVPGIPMLVGTMGTMMCMRLPIESAYAATKLAIGTAGIGVERAIRNLNAADTVASMFLPIDSAYTATKLAIGAAGIGVERAIQNVNDATNPPSDTDKDEDN